MSDYVFNERRKNKNDKRAKAKYNKYKRGGKHRSDNIFNRREEDKKD